MAALSPLLIAAVLGQVLGSESAIISTPQDGLEVHVLNKVDTSATTPPNTPLEVVIPGGIDLKSNTLNVLNNRTCALGKQERTLVGGSIRALPPTSPMVNRNSISVTFHAGTGRLVCKGVTGTDPPPTCTLPTASSTETGWQLDPGGGTTLEISNTYELQCIYCATNGNPSSGEALVSYTEVSCQS